MGSVKRSTTEGPLLQGQKFQSGMLSEPSVQIGRGLERPSEAQEIAPVLKGSTLRKKKAKRQKAAEKMCMLTDSKKSSELCVSSNQEKAGKRKSQMGSAQGEKGGSNP